PTDPCPVSLHDALPIVGEEGGHPGRLLAWRPFMRHLGLVLPLLVAGCATPRTKMSFAEALRQPEAPPPRIELFVLGAAAGAGLRSEEHTSELQSRENLV